MTKGKRTLGRCLKEMIQPPQSSFWDIVFFLRKIVFRLWYFALNSWGLFFIKWTVCAKSTDSVIQLHVDKTDCMHLTLTANMHVNVLTATYNI